MKDKKVIPGTIGYYLKMGNEEIRKQEEDISLRVEALETYQKELGPVEKITRRIEVLEENLLSKN